MTCLPQCGGIGRIWTVPLPDVEAARQEILRQFSHAEAPRLTRAPFGRPLALDLAANAFVDLD